ncbi:MAG: HD domain-containing protein [Planctomycetes bacterium]|nr:HD domain-containing protein [Planctomycetota bacterium]
MRRIQIDDIAPGMRLARSLYYQYGGVMLAAGAALDERSIARLREFGYRSLYIHDTDLDDVICHDYIDEQARQKITHHVTTLYDHLREETRNILDPADIAEASGQELREKMEDRRFQRAFERARVPDTFLEAVEKIMESILSDREMALCVGTIKTVNTFLYDHSLEVAIHAAILAKHLGFPRGEIRDIVLGSMLHDIGHIFLPEDLVKRKTPPTESEMETLRQHTVLGYYLLKERSDISLLSAHVAYQHHERQDGAGYPRGLTGRNRIIWKQEALGSGTIHRFAEVVAVPDFYDELTSDLPYRKAVPPDEAAQAVREAAGTGLNDEVVQAFLSYLPVFPIGTSVVVTTGKFAGWRGVVVGLDRSDLSRPQVRLLYDPTHRLKKPVNVNLLEDDETSVRADWK